MPPGAQVEEVEVSCGTHHRQDDQADQEERPRYLLPDDCGLLGKLVLDGHPDDEGDGEGGEADDHLQVGDGDGFAHQRSSQEPNPEGGAGEAGQSREERHRTRQVDVAFKHCRLTTNQVEGKSTENTIRKCAIFCSLRGICRCSNIYVQCHLHKTYGGLLEACSAPDWRQADRFSSFHGIPVHLSR